MAPPEKYRLQTLLGIRERKKEEAEQHLGKCIQALKTEQDRLLAMEKELEQMVQRRESKKREYAEKAMRGEMSAQSAISANVYIDRLKEMEDTQRTAIEGQKATVAEKQQAVDGARAALVTANQEMKALEKHKEKWQQQRKKEVEAKQDEAMDELAQTIFLNKE